MMSLAYITPLRSIAISMNSPSVKLNVTALAVTPVAGFTVYSLFVNGAAAPVEAEA